MKAIRSMLVMGVAGAALAGGFFGGTSLFEHLQFARAADEVAENRSQISQAEDLSTVFRHVGKVVEPSVVNIDVVKTVKQPTEVPNDLRRFFPNAPNGPQDNGGGNAPNGGDNSGDMQEIGTGSGVVMSVDGNTGYILTNNHVAGDAAEMMVTLADGRQFKNAKLVGADAKSDLAVVKITADGLIAAKWGDSSELEKGDWILAFGSPFRYIGSMTHGIVSALDRDNVNLLERGSYEDFIQVDAPINPGNSGGPLVNLHGEVVGINTAIASHDGGFQGIGFAIPSNQAHWVFDQLKSHGKITRGWLGIGIGDVSDPEIQKTARTFNYTGETGVLVEQTFPNTPAQGKLLEGDIITAVGNTPVENTRQLRNAIAMTTPGSEVHLSVFRDGKKTDVPLTVASQPDDVVAATTPGAGNQARQGRPGAVTIDSVGLTVVTLTATNAQQLGLDNLRSGAVITSVARNSLAADAGLAEGDVITRVNSARISNAAEVADAVNKGDLTRGVRLYVTNSEGQRFVTLQSDK